MADLKPGQPGYNRQRMNQLKRDRGEPVVTDRPATRGELQRQGVPIPSHLRGPKAKPSKPSKPAKAVKAKPPKSHSRPTSSRRKAAKAATLGKLAPDKVASSAGSVGTLTAEFLGALVLLLFTAFTGKSSYEDKIMSVMKRGTLLCALFFVLAMMSSIGPNMARAVKAFGALVIVAMLVTSNVGDMSSAMDNLIKNDWTGSGENGGSADTGTQGGTSPNPVTGLVKGAEQAVAPEGQSMSVSNPLSVSGVEEAAKNALTGLLNGIIPGAGTFDSGKIASDISDEFRRFFP